MKKTILLLTMLMMLIPSTVFGFETTAETPVSVRSDGIYSTDGALIITKDSAEYKQLLEAFGESVRSDTETGFTELKKGDVISDHLKLKIWGKVLYYYAGKSTSEMPLDYLLLNNSATGGYIRLNNDRETKEWIRVELMPYIEGVIREVANKYICDVYIYKPTKPQTLSEFATNYNTIETELNYSVIPISSDTEHLRVHSIGAEYGVQLDTKYVSILDATDKDNGAFKLMTKEGTKISCVKVVAELASPKNINGDLNFASKKLVDMTVYEGFFINLITGDLLLSDSLDGFKLKSAGGYDNNRMIKDDFRVVTLTDGVCVVPTKLHEVLQYGSKVYPTGVIADFDDILRGTDTIKLSDGQLEKADSYISKDGLMKITRGNQSPFLLYSRDDKLPYSRFVGWLLSDASGAYVTKEQAQDMVNQIKSIYTKSGNSNEWKVIAKQYGLNSGISLPLLGGAVLCLVSAGVVAFITIKKGKNKVKRGNNADLLFKLEEDEEDKL